MECKARLVAHFSLLSPRLVLRVEKDQLGRLDRFVWPGRSGGAESVGIFLLVTADVSPRERIQEQSL